MTRIFISYRRAESSAISGRIYDRLVAVFESKNVFMDVHAIPPGADFRGVLKEAASRCDVMLPLIGAQWATITDDDGKRRLFNADDFVRMEVEMALQRTSCTVIPVLLCGASMPAPGDLPDTLRELAFRNAVPVRDDPDFGHDMDNLLHAVEGCLRATSEPRGELSLADQLYERAYAEYDAGNIAEARLRAGDCLQVDANHEGARGLLRVLAGRQEPVAVDDAPPQATLEDVTAVAMAFQEYGLKNYRQAYALARPVLDRNPENAHVSYLVGLLGLVYGNLDESLQLLRVAHLGQPESASVEGAYGVALRRAARAAARDGNPDYGLDLLELARQRMTHALAAEPGLLDHNAEPFWGTLGGVLRDLGCIEDALQAYESGLDIKPLSSYLLGNRASLRLQLHRENPARWDTLLDAFDEMRRVSQAELATAPDEYFPAMDLAMAYVMLGRRDAADFAHAHESLEHAMDLRDATSEQLGVSLAGWESLLQACPEIEPDPPLNGQPVPWAEVRANLQQAIDAVHQAIEHRRFAEGA